MSNSYGNVIGLDGRSERNCVQCNAMRCTNMQIEDQHKLIGTNSFAIASRFNQFELRCRRTKKKKTRKIVQNAHAHTRLLSCFCNLIENERKKYCLDIIECFFHNLIECILTLINHLQCVFFFYLRCLHAPHSKAFSLHFS